MRFAGRRISTAAVLLALAVSLPAMSLAAPGSSQFASPQSAPVRQGIQVPATDRDRDRRVDVSLGTAVVYDSNAAGLSAQGASVEGLSEADVLVPVDLRLDIEVPFGRNAVSLGGRAGYRFHARNTQLNSEAIGLEAAFERELDACQVAVAADYRRARSQLYELIFVAGTSDNIDAASRIEGTLSCGAAVGFRPYFGAASAHDRNSLAARREAEFDTNSYGAGIVYVHPAIGEIGLVGNIDETAFPHRQADVPGSARRLQVKSGGIYFKRAVARQLQVELLVSYLDIDDPGVNHRYHEIGGNASVRLMPGGRLTVVGTVSREAVPSRIPTVGAQLETRASLSLAAAASARLDVALGYQIDHREYGNGALAGPGARGGDTVSSAGISGTYHLGPRLDLETASRYQLRRTDDPIFTFDSLRFSIGANLKL